MNFPAQQNSQIEFLEHVNDRIDNFTDLTSYQNDSIVEFARILFSKSTTNLDTDLSGILLDDSMDSLDLFCMLIELLLNGIDIVFEGKTIFDLEDITQVASKINPYLKSAGFELAVCPVEFDESELFRDTNNYYYEILPKPPKEYCKEEWCVLNNRIRQNKNFNQMPIDNFENFNIFFIHNSRVYTVKFKNYRHI